MPDSPPSERFKAEMPHIPGVSEPLPPLPPPPAASFDRNSVLWLVAVVIGAAVLIWGARWALRPKSAEPAAAAPPQIEVPAAAPDPLASLPHATEEDPGIATVSELAKPWATKEFFFRNRLTGDDVPSMIMRLPGGSAALPSGYWAFDKNSPYGDCQLEFIANPAKLASDYGFRGATHPMVGNPCSRTVFDPVKMALMPGNIWVRGTIVQGSDLRPPLGIELKIQGKQILAVGME